MITTIKRNTIDINGTTEWLLFYRMTNKVSPIDFLILTDSVIQLPNFLFSISFLVTMFTGTELWLKLAIPCVFYFIGQFIVNFKLGSGDLKWLKYPLVLFSSGNIIFMLAILITAVFILSYYAFLIIPLYLITLTISVTVLNFNERKLYKIKWNNSTGYYDIFKNNAFLVSYKYFAEKFDLNKQITPTEEEIQGQVWLSSFSYMKNNWGTFESKFNEHAQDHWRAYLNISK